MATIDTTAMEKAIRDQLPGAVGEELQKVLAQAKLDAATVVSQRETIEANEAKFKELYQKSVTIQAENTELKAQANGVKKREEAVLQVEHKLEIAAIREGCAVESKKELFALAGIVFKNPELKFSESIATPILVNTSPGYEQLQTHFGSRTRTETRE